VYLLSFYFAHFLDFVIDVAGELFSIHSQLGKELLDSKSRENKLKPFKETSIPVPYPQSFLESYTVFLPVWQILLIERN